MGSGIYGISSYFGRTPVKRHNVFLTIFFFMFALAVTASEELFPYPEGKAVVLRKEFEVDFNESPYMSKIEILGANTTEGKTRTLWDARFTNPSLFGTGEGRWQAYVSYPCPQNFFFIRTTYRFLAGGSEVIITEINVNQDFKVKESSFLINLNNKGLGSHLDLIPQKVSDNLMRIDVTGGARGDSSAPSLAYLFNREANMLLPLFSRWQLAYLALPFESALFLKQPGSTQKKIYPEWPAIRIDEVTIADIRGCFETFDKGYCSSFTNRLLITREGYDYRKNRVPNPSLDFMRDWREWNPYQVYLMVMGIAEYRHLLDQAKQLKTPLPDSEVSIVEGATSLSSTPQDTAVEQGKQLINRYLSALTPQKRQSRPKKKSSASTRTTNGLSSIRLKKTQKNAREKR